MCHYRVKDCLLGQCGKENHIFWHLFCAKEQDIFHTIKLTQIISIWLFAMGIYSMFASPLYKYITHRASQKSRESVNTKPARQRTGSFHDTKLYKIKWDLSNYEIYISSGRHCLTYKGSSVGRRYFVKKAVFWKVLSNSYFIISCHSLTVNLTFRYLKNWLTSLNFS